MRQIAVALFLLVAAPEATPWHTFKAPDGSFSVDFPFSAPAKIEDRASTTWSTSDGRDEFKVQMFRDPKYTTANAEAILNNYPILAVSGVEGKVTWDSYVRHREAYFAKGFRIDGVLLPKRVVVIQMVDAYVTEGRLTLLTVNTTGGHRPVTPLSKRFFSSFQILK